MARTFQNVALFPALTVLENVMMGAHCRGTVGFGRAALRLGVAKEERETRERCRELLERLDLGRYADRPAAGLPVRHAEADRVRPGAGQPSPGC